MAHPGRASGTQVRTQVGSVISIHISPEAGEPMDSLVEVQALAGAGLVGDRYFRGMGTYSGADVVGRQLTLIEGEALEAASAETAMDIRPRDSRRNIVTQGMSLNDLVGREFMVGEVRMRGVELCEPCSHLAQLAGKPMLRSLVHRGGLRADILSDGVIRVGDSIS